jgi:RNA-directed DNA polymerase
MAKKKWTEANVTNHSTMGESSGRNPQGYAMRVQSEPLEGVTYPDPDTTNLFQQMLQRPNMVKAWNRVKSNKGCAGADNKTIIQTETFLKTHWAKIRGKLESGTYVPDTVKEVLIPKSSGGTRALGIPTVLDRLIQQAMLQVLSPVLDPTFSESSFGFREGRSAKQAILQSRRFARDGFKWVVDIDLENFFDEVHHDVLMSELEKKIRDRKLLSLIRKYLRAGVLRGGLAFMKEKGTPQGGPLSPLLSNVMLDVLDKELERRGHNFCRYADDCNIYVASKRAGFRVFDSVLKFLNKRLRLRVNEDKSKVVFISKSVFVGFGFAWKGRNLCLTVPKVTTQRFRKKLKVMFSRGKGCNLESWIKYKLNPVLRGWANYFNIAETKKFADILDQWVRRRLRLILWRQWKRPWTRFLRLKRLGLSESHARMSAFNGRGQWFNSGAPHMNLALPGKFFQNLGLISLLDSIRCVRLEY